MEALVVHSEDVNQQVQPSPATARAAATNKILHIKKLTASDAFTSKQIKLPRAEARKFIGELRNKQSVTLDITDEHGRTWNFLCTCYNCQYALSKIGMFCHTHDLKPGDYLIFYLDCTGALRVACRRTLPAQLHTTPASRAAAAQRASTDQDMEQGTSAQTLNAQPETPRYLLPVPDMQHQQPSRQPPQAPSSASRPSLGNFAARPRVLHDVSNMNATMRPGMDGSKTHASTPQHNKPAATTGGKQPGSARAGARATPLPSIEKENATPGIPSSATRLPAKLQVKYDNRSAQLPTWPSQDVGYSSLSAQLASPNRRSTPLAAQDSDERNQSQAMALAAAYQQAAARAVMPFSDLAYLQASGYMQPFVNPCLMPPFHTLPSAPGSAMAANNYLLYQALLNNAMLSAAAPFGQNLSPLGGLNTLAPLYNMHATGASGTAQMHARGAAEHAGTPRSAASADTPAPNQSLTADKEHAGATRSQHLAAGQATSRDAMAAAGVAAAVGTTDKAGADMVAGEPGNPWPMGYVRDHSDPEQAASRFWHDLRLRR